MTLWLFLMTISLLIPYLIHSPYLYTGSYIFPLVSIGWTAYHLGHG